MALAALFSKIKKLKIEFPAPSPTRSFPLGIVQAFIVDHQAREASEEEAKIVAQRLEDLGAARALQLCNQMC
jgi:hypothetical protein